MVGVEKLRPCSRCQFSSRKCQARTDRKRNLSSQVGQGAQYENPVGNWQWELLNIGFPNSIQSLQVRLRQLEIIAFECEMLPAKPRRLAQLRKTFKFIAQSAVSVD